jgi:hypothetical protein
VGHGISMPSAARVDIRIPPELNPSP